MKKFFFFKSSSSSNTDNNPSDNEVKSQVTDKSAKNENSPSLRRSRSYSSGVAYDAQRNLSCLNTHGGSPCSSSNDVTLKRFDSSSSRRTLTPERQPIVKWFRDEKPHSRPSSRSRYDSSESSANSSGSNVLDRFIDGEQQEEKNKQKSNSSVRTNFAKRPPRVQHPTAASPTNSKQKPKSSPSENNKGSQHHFSTGEWAENGLGQESPRKLAKHVIERLSQSRYIPRSNSKEFDADMPITIQDLYGGSLLNRSPSSAPDDILNINSPSSGSDPDDVLNRSSPLGGSDEITSEEDIDNKLLRKSKEMKEWAMHLSDELENDNIFEDGVFNVSTLVQKVRNLMEEKINMALEVSAMLDDRMAERASAKAELDSRTRRLEKEKNELQLVLEKELDRRSNDWSFKLEKYQVEEHRLRERVRELAEQNVSLQQEVSSFNERDIDSRTRLTQFESQLKEVSDENQVLHKNLLELKERNQAAEEERDCFKKNYKEKENECKGLHGSITRMMRKCSEQEKTINGLREGLNEEIKKKSLPENFQKLQMEQMRLTGVELALRKEVESYKQEVNSLRRENVNLLHRLKASGKEGRSSFKLDQELWDRVMCLESQGLGLLNASTQLSDKLLEFIKVQVGDALDQRVDGQVIVESDTKIQGFKRGTENLIRSLRNVSAVLHDKKNLEDGSVQLNDKSSEDVIRSELKAEMLLTSLLKEKLYSKEMNVEQLEAELAAAARVNDILRCEVQNAMDSLSCVIHKTKDLELQLMNKDENMNRLQNDLQECSKELNIMRGILPKISEERDMMWAEVKQYSEKTMLLNSQVDEQKKRIEALDEDILLKEGQITILKDTIGKPFDLLGSPDHIQEFKLER